MWIMEKFNEGGIFMFFILAFGVMTLAVVIERYLLLYKKTTEPTESLRSNLLGLLMAGQTSEAVKRAEQEQFSAFARISKIGIQLRAEGAGDEEVQARMDEALSREIYSIDRRTGFLAMFGNVATLLGLLGTISGMIHSFAAVANANPADRATLLSKGIS